MMAGRTVTRLYDSPNETLQHENRGMHGWNVGRQ